jgi:uncharacterized protein (TIGR03435 family)
VTVLMIGGALSGPHIRLVDVSLTDLVSAVYNRPGYQILGTKHWLDSERYDVLANVRLETTRANAFGMRSSGDRMTEAVY